MIRLLALATLLVPTFAFADVAPDISPGSRFVNHAIMIQNLDAHPNYAVVVYDAPRNGLIGGHKIFSQIHSAKHVLTRGASWRSREVFSSARLHLLPLRAAIAWQRETDREIERQREACFERGEGCVHASRFFPRYAPPPEVTSCSAEVEMVYELAGPGPDEVVDTFRLVTASANRCRVERVGASVAASRDRDSQLLPLAILGGGIALFAVVFARRRRTAPA